MTAPEYIQLKAYARQDGFFLALFWIVCFISYIIGLTNQLVGMLSMLMVVASPFFVATRLKKFRDEGREGVISFGRSYAYTIFVFFYGAVLLAEAKMMLEQYGAQSLVDEGLAEMAATRPIDYALNILTINISLGFILGVPIGLIMQRRKLD